MNAINAQNENQKIIAIAMHPLKNSLTIQYPTESQKPVFQIQAPENQSNPRSNIVTPNTVKNNLTSNPMLTLNTSNPMMNNLTSNPKQNYAIIVPCYNEEKRFPYQAFLSFAQKHPEVLICFVNDGSKDKTLAVLKGIQSESPENICVYSLEQNGGKSEAVRQGMLYMHLNFEVELLGFLDADLATTPEEWLQMAKYKEQYSQFGAIVGSRIQRLGANINRDDSRSLISSIIKKFIRVILKSSFQDTQCGAKIFQRDLVTILFNQPFMTPWLFDVEIFLRLQQKFGKTTLQKGVLEFPLMHWTEVGDSRLKLKHTIKIPMQLLKLHFQYNISKKFNTKSGYSLFDNQNNNLLINKAIRNAAALFL